MKSDYTKSQLYHFVKQQIAQELGISVMHTEMEEALLCRLTILVYAACEKSLDPLETQIQYVLCDQQHMIQHTLYPRMEGIRKEHAV